MIWVSNFVCGSLTFYRKVQGFNMSRTGRSFLTCRLLPAALAASLAVPVAVHFASLPAVAQAAEGMEKAEALSDAQVAIDKLVARVKAGEADQVFEECNKAIEANAKNYVAYVGRGLANIAKKDFDAAIKDLNKATTVDGREPSDIDTRSMAYTYCSEAQFEKGQYIEAVDSAYFALLERPTNARAHMRRSMAYNGWNRPDKAIYSADRALALDPKLADAISSRGIAYGIKKNYAKSIEDQTKAISMEKDVSAYYERRAMAHLMKKEYDKASKDIEEALRLDPDNADALCDRAAMYGMAGKMGQAIGDLDSALKKNPASFRAHYQKALTLQFQKMPEAALTSVNDAIRLNSGFLPSLILRGNLYNETRQFDKAVEDFTAAITLDPSSLEAYTGRSMAYKRLNKQELAKADTAKMRELQPDSKSSSSKKKEKDDEVDVPMFKVASKGVDPSRRGKAKEAAAQIDKFVAANHVKYKIQPNPKTSDSEFVRRIYLDIVGTIPTYQQTVKFLISKDPEKRANLIDELLASDGYASHSFNYWADTLRYVDRISEDVRGEPYRQWIKQSLAENKPWDKLVYELITSEGLIWESPATGYMQRDSNMPLDNMNNTVRIFLGTRIGCAQCHNHPFDRWTQKEFYQMAAFTFGTTTRVGLGDKRYWSTNPNERLQEEYQAIVQEEEDRRNNSYAFSQILRVNSRIVGQLPSRQIQLPKDYAYDDAKPSQVIEPQTLFGSKAQVRTGETRQQSFARWLTEKENPRFALTIANRLWQRTFGIGQIEPVDDMTDHTVAENPPLMEFLEKQMKDLNFDMKEYLRILYNTETYQRQACFDETPIGAPYHFPGPALRRMTAEQVWDSFLTLAVVDPEEYREIIRTDMVSYDLNTVSAMDLLNTRKLRAEVDRKQYKLQQKYRYKGVLLARASELPSPLPAGHFIRVFGQSDRELISASSTTGSVPQVLFMFNGPVSHMLLEKNSTIYNNVMKKKTVNDGVKVVFLTVLNREPDAEDLALAAQEIQLNGPPGYGNVIWSLVNTREFLFIQ